MLGFELDFLALLKIIGIDVILGIDNAIVIALACATLSMDVRNKAVALGTAGAIIARVVFLFIGFWLLTLPLVKAVAGLYLVYLGYSLISSHINGQEENPDIKSTDNFWKAVGTIVVADVMMSLDNVIAVTSAAESAGEHAFAYAIFGIVLSIPIILFAAKGLMKLIDKFPIIVWLGSALIAWVGVELLLKEPFIANWISSHHYFEMFVTLKGITHELIQASVVVLIMLVCLFKMNKLKQA